MLSENEVLVLTNDVLGRNLRASGFERAEVAEGIDHAGERALFVTAHFRPGARVDSARVSLDAATELWNALLERRDDRFPYISYDYPDDERPDESASWSEEAEPLP